MPCVEKIWRSEFTELYGAIAQCESSIPVKDLRRRIENTLNLKKQLGITSKKDMRSSIQSQSVCDLQRVEAKRLEQIKKKIEEKSSLLYFDENGSPNLAGLEKHFEGKASFFKQLRERYRFYRGECHRGIYKNIRKIFEWHQAIANEFLERDLDPDCPLIDLRDRCFRLERMEKERVYLGYGWKSSVCAHGKFVENLSSSQKLIFKIASFFHSFFVSPFNLVRPLRLPKMPTDCCSLNENKVAKFGETEITFNGKTIPVEITANFKLYNKLYKGLYGRYCFLVRRKDNKELLKELLGSIHSSRRWSDSEDRAIEESADKPTTTLCNRRLYFKSLRDDLGQDQTNGDRPIMRLLTQIAVEVFRLESETKLEIANVDRDVDVFYAAGFHPSPNSQNFEKERTNIVKERSRAREDKKLFPGYRKFSCFHVFLYKSPSPVQDTQFVSVNNEPAYVDFKMNSHPITWEKQIKNKPLLGKREGPILPKFFKRNFFKYEQKVAEAKH